MKRFRFRCIYLGDKVGEVSCGCTANRIEPLFTCAVHAVCTIVETDTPHNCRSCEEYKPSDQLLKNGLSTKQ